MRKPNQPYSDSFKNQVMEDYFSGELSLQACARKWKIPAQSLNNWVKICKNAQKSVSLHPKLKKMDAKDQVIEDLRAENERLRRESEWQRLRVAGYERLLEIIKQEDGIDLLKKDGAKQ
jgi:transposase-like protein